MLGMGVARACGQETFAAEGKVYRAMVLWNASTAAKTLVMNSSRITAVYQPPMYASERANRKPVGSPSSPGDSRGAWRRRHR